MKRRVGYVGKDDVPVGVALAGILHYEHEGKALCNRRPLSYRAEPERILNDPGLMIGKLIICKRCTKLEEKA